MSFPTVHEMIHYDDYKYVEAERDDLLKENEILANRIEDLEYENRILRDQLSDVEI